MITTPPYCPWFNLAEKAFLMIKRKIKFYQSKNSYSSLKFILHSILLLKISQKIYSKFTKMNCSQYIEESKKESVQNFQTMFNHYYKCLKSIIIISKCFIHHLIYYPLLLCLFEHLFED